MIKKLLVGLLGLVWVPSISAAIYAESVNGDLSDNYLMPTSFGLEIGSNLLSGSLSGGEGDVDLFTLTVPANASITAIRIIEFTGGRPSGSFFGLQPGAMLSSEPASDFPDAIGYAIITATNAATDADVLSSITLGPPFFRATSLPTGQYAGWLNETGSGSTYTIDFVVSGVPEPASGLLGMIGIISLMSYRRRL